jgi:hypothetical protein
MIASASNASYIRFSRPTAQIPINDDRSKTQIVSSQSYVMSYIEEQAKPSNDR